MDNSPRTDGVFTYDVKNAEQCMAALHIGASCVVASAVMKGGKETADVAVIDLRIAIHDWSRLNDWQEAAV